MRQEPKPTSPHAVAPGSAQSESMANLAHVRYQGTDIERSIGFYTRRLGT